MSKRSANVIFTLAIVICIIAGLLGSFGCSTEMARSQVSRAVETTTEAATEITVAADNTEGMLKLPDVTGDNLYKTILLLKDRGFTNIWHYSSSDEGIIEGFENWRIISQNIDPWTYIYPDDQIILICEWDQEEPTTTVPETTAPETVMSRVVETTAAQTQAVHTYVLNTNTGKIHVEGCRSVSQMKDSNKLYVTATLEEILEWYPGYTACGNCHARY